MLSEEIAHEPLDGELAGRAAPSDRAWHHDSAAGNWGTGVFRSIDRILRRWMRIEQFCSDPRCVIRVAIVRAPKDLRLADGTRVVRGDPVGELHFWNEQLPHIPGTGPGLAWALTMRRQFTRSLVQLARHAVSDAEFSAIVGFRGNITFGGDLTRFGKVSTVARRFGFEVIEGERTAGGRVREMFDSIFIFLLIHTFNPGAIKRARLMRRRYELWISRDTLLERYGRGYEGP